jgi:hypothetical protein
MYGDGSPIPDEVAEHITDVYRRCEAAFAWEPGDVLVVDNLLVAHGRRSFRGERAMLVAMGDMVRADDVGVRRW